MPMSPLAKGIPDHPAVERGPEGFGQGLVLPFIDIAHRVKNDEKKHEKRDHIRIGKKPALGVFRSMFLFPFLFLHVRRVFPP